MPVGRHRLHGIGGRHAAGGGAVADLGIVRFDLLGEGAGRVVADTRTSGGDRFKLCWQPPRASRMKPIAR